MSENYSIQLSKEELEALEKGVELWEKEPQHSSFMGSVFGAIMAPRDDPIAMMQFKQCEQEAKATAEAEMRKRKSLSLRLRAKLIEAIDHPAEFQT
jgi:hypothetical protein